MLTSAQGDRVTPEHTMVDGIIELTDQLMGWSAESSLQVVKFRGSAFLRGRHAFKITERRHRRASTDRGLAGATFMP